MQASPPLAIIVPAYKASHLAATLRSIAAQTEQSFRLYVFDDASPESLAPIVDAFDFPRHRLVYHRFSSNLGGTSLVLHWHRCINLTPEPWIWLFSDDDLMEAQCVAAFYEALARTKSAYNVYRYNTLIVNAEGRCIELCPTHPEWEPAREFAYFFLKRVRRASQQEMIFRRAAYEFTGGIIDLPLAWYADTVFALSVGKESGIYTISGPKVRFRLSGYNISSHRTQLTDRLKREALLMFFDWFQRYIDETGEDGSMIENSMLKSSSHSLFINGIRRSNRFVGFKDLARIRNLLKRHNPHSLRSDTLKILLHNSLILPKATLQFLRN